MTVAQIQVSEFAAGGWRTQRQSRVLALCKLCELRRPMDTHTRTANSRRETG